MRKMHTNILSKKSLKKIYNFKREKSVPDITKLYEIRPDGWRRKSEN